MTTPATGEQSTAGAALRTTALAVVCVVLGGALVEDLILAVQRISSPMMPISQDFAWMNPLTLAVIACVVAAPFALEGAWRRRAPSAAAIFVSSMAAAANILMFARGLSRYAALLVACGVAVQLTRFAVRHPAGLRRVPVRLVPWFALCLVLLNGWVWWSARPAGPARSPQAVTASARPPSLLLITLDAVRAENMSLYGYPKATTPNLERFAQRGVTFDQALAAAPWTLPSHASLFTGRWPHELSTDYTTPLDGTYETLAEYLASHGYETAGFAANLGYCSRPTGLARGFQHYEDYPVSLGQMVSNSTLARNVADNFGLRRLAQNDQHLNRVGAEQMNQRVLSWFSRRSDAPFFVFLNYFDAHEPYLPPSPFDREFGPGRNRGQYSPLHRWLWEPGVAHREMSPGELREEVGAYDGSLAYLDSQLGRLIDALTDRSLLENTLVVITADHGEEFGEHGLFDHGYSLYRQTLQVPLVVVDPGRVPGGRRVPQPVSLRDVAATIVGALGLEGGSPFPGQSLAALWANGTQADGRPARQPSAPFSEVRRASGQPSWFPVSKGDMKALLYQGVRCIANGDGTEELYDFQNDPEERRDLAREPAYRPVLAACSLALRKLGAS